MKCALAAVGFINGDLQHNQKVIIDTMISCAAHADIVIFGEAFLQGFYAATFDTVHDTEIAISLDDPTIAQISTIAKQYKIAVSFGFIEKAEDRFYSSQITIDTNGSIIDIFRRVSPGWKEAFANEKYCEGKGFHLFSFKGKQVAAALCGDLWFDKNILEMKQLKPDVVFWPVYTDFNYNEWNTSIKHEYTAQASKFCNTVLYVNSFCKDKEGDEFAKGGAALFQSGSIVAEVSSGKEAILFVEV